MPDSEISVAVVGNFDGLESAMKGAVSSVEYGADALSQAYYSISGSVLKAEADAKSLADALSGANSIPPPEPSGWLSMASAMAVGVLEAEALKEALKKIYEGIKEAIFGTSELAEKLHNMSESTGISVDGLERLRYASELAGKDFENLQRGVTQLALKMLELQAGSSNPALESAMQKLGLTPEQLSDSEHALDNIADAWNRVGDSIPKQEKIGAIREILGRQGADFIPVLEKLDEANAKFDALNIGLGSATDSALKAKEAMNELGASFERLKEGAGALFAGPLTSVANRLTEIVTVARQLASFDFSSFTNPSANKSAIDAAIAGQIGGSKSKGIESDLASDTATPAEPSKRAFQQEITDYIAGQHLIVAAAGDTAAARMQAEENIVAFLKSKESEAATWRIDLSQQEGSAELAASAARKANQNEVVSAEKAVTSGIESELAKRGAIWDGYYRDQQALARATAAGEIQVEQARFGLVQAQIAQEYEEHKISKDQRTQLLLQLEDERYASEMRSLDAEIAALGAGTAAEAAALAKRETLEIQHETAKTQIQTNANKGTPFDQLGTSVTNQAERAFTSLTTRAQTAHQFLQQTFQSIASEFIHLVVSMVAQSAAFGAIETGLKSIFTSIAPAAAAALTASETTKQALVAQKAGEAAAAQFANVITTVPFPENLALAPSAAAEAFAQTEALGQAEGGALLGSTGRIIQTHPEEMILPAPLSKGIQQLIQNGGDGGAVHFHVHAIDASGMAAFFEKNKGHLADALVSAKRNAHPSIAELRR